MSLQRIGIRHGMLAVAIVVATAGTAWAHDVWLTLAGDAGSRRVVVNYGHPGDRPPTMPDKVLELVAIGSDRTTSLLPGIAPVQEDGIPVVVSQPFADNGPLLLAARYDNGFWIKRSDGLYRNATRRLAPDAMESLWSSKFAKALSGPDAPWQEVLGHDLEIVPLSDPDKVTTGQALRLKVLFQGKPLPRAEVERGDGVTAVPESDIPRFVTDAEGIASIPIVKSGPHLLVIDHRVTPSATPDQANTDLFAATLWFSIGR
jgi:nickel transport protein